MTCECGLKFNLEPRGILKYEDHLPCPAAEARFQEVGFGREV